MNGQGYEIMKYKKEYTHLFICSLAVNHYRMFPELQKINSVQIKHKNLLQSSAAGFVQLVAM